MKRRRWSLGPGRRRSGVPDGVNNIAARSAMLTAHVEGNGTPDAGTRCRVMQPRAGLEPRVKCPVKVFRNVLGRSSEPKVSDFRPPATLSRTNMTPGRIDLGSYRVPRGRLGQTFGVRALWKCIPSSSFPLVYLLAQMDLINNIL